MKKITILHDPVEASLVESILKEEGIPHLIRSLEDKAYGNLFQLSHGWGELWGQEQDEERLNQLIEELREGSSFLSPEGLPLEDEDEV